MLEKDKNGLNTGLAWFSTDHRESLIEVIKLHNAVKYLIFNIFSSGLVIGLKFT